ncbi:MAG: hypothetical protein AAFP90_21940, partial [Planctomycetota bacterium]
MKPTIIRCVALICCVWPAILCRGQVIDDPSTFGEPIGSAVTSIQTNSGPQKPFFDEYSESPVPATPLMMTQQPSAAPGKSRKRVDVFRRGTSQLRTPSPFGASIVGSYTSGGGLNVDNL